MFVSGSESLGNSVPVYCSGSTSFDVRSWKISCKNFQGLLSIVQLSMFMFVVAVSCDSFYIISKCFMFVNNFFISFLLLWSSSSRDSLFRIAYSPRLVNSFLISFCNLLFSKFSSEYSHTHARIFMQNFLFFIRSASACHSLVSVSTSERCYLTTAFLNCQCCFYILRNSEYSDISSAIRIVRRISCSHEKTADYTNEMSATLWAN